MTSLARFLSLANQKVRLQGSPGRRGPPGRVRKGSAWLYKHGWRSRAGGRVERLRVACGLCGSVGFFEFLAGKRRVKAPRVGTEVTR